MQDHKSIPTRTLRLIASKLQAIAVPSRLSILNELRSGEKTVSALVRTTRMGQANVSKHLRTLRDARLVSFRKAGLQSFYQISDPVVFQLCDLLCNSLNNHPARNNAPRKSSNSSRKSLPASRPPKSRLKSV